MELQSPQSVSDQLISEAIPWKSDNGPFSKKNQWNSGRIRAILSRPVYVGLRVDLKAGGDSRKKDTALVKGVWDGIIDQRTFDETQVILEKNTSRNSAATRIAGQYYLRDSLYCPHCSTGFGIDSSNKAGKKHRYYKHAKEKKRIVLLQIEFPPRAWKTL